MAPSRLTSPHLGRYLGPMTTPVTYRRTLGLFSGTMAVVGGIIGSGIFNNPAIVAQRVGTSTLTLGVWILGGVVALIGAFCFGELGQRRPQAGGELRLSARGAGTAAGLSVRLVAAAGHRDRCDRRGGGDLRELRPGPRGHERHRRTLARRSGDRSCSRRSTSSASARARSPPTSSRCSSSPRCFS